MRAFAAIAVIIHHIEHWKSLNGYPSAWESPVIQSFGAEGVNIFFCLSGFLITYLLLDERLNTGAVAVESFYRRRCYRILPLYFVVIGLTFFIIPAALKYLPSHLPAVQFLNESHAGLANTFILTLGLYLLLLPNIAWLTLPIVVGAGQTWSLGYEEQFYLLWPWLFKLRRGAFVPVIAAAVVLKIALLSGFSGSTDLWYRYLQGFRLEYLAAGALAAWLLQMRPQFTARVLIRRPIQYCAVPALLGILAFRQMISLGGLTDTVCAGAAALLLLNLSQSRLPVLNLEITPLNYLGKISYGLYMLHPTAIIIALVLLQHFSLLAADAPLHNSLLIYPAVLLFTFSLAAASYRFIEEPLRQLGKRNCAKQLTC